MRGLASLGHVQARLDGVQRSKNINCAPVRDAGRCEGARRAAAQVIVSGCVSVASHFFCAGRGAAAGPEQQEQGQQQQGNITSMFTSTAWVASTSTSTSMSTNISKDGVLGYDKGRDL